MSGFSEYGVEVDNVIIIVMQHYFSEVATFHVTEVLADGGNVTRDYSVAPGTAHEETEKVMNEDIYKVHVRIILSVPGRSSLRYDCFTSEKRQKSRKSWCILLPSHFTTIMHSSKWEILCKV